MLLVFGHKSKYWTNGSENFTKDHIPNIKLLVVLEEKPEDHQSPRIHSVGAMSLMPIHKIINAVGLIIWTTWISVLNVNTSNIC